MKAKSKSSIPCISADGIKIRRGMVVWLIFTNDAGKTWAASKKMVEHTTRRGMVTFVKEKSRLRVWHYCHEKQIGDHRIYAEETNARTECKHRNKRK